MVLSVCPMLFAAGGGGGGGVITTLATFTDYTTDGQTASASSEFSVPQYSVWKAMDNDKTATRWATTSGDTVPWLKVDFGAGNTFAPTTYSIKAGYGPAMMTAWILEGSDDDAVWNTLDTVVGEPAWSNDEERTGYSCDTVAGYRYVRLRCTSRPGGQGAMEVLDFRMVTT